MAATLVCIVLTQVFYWYMILRKRGGPMVALLALLASSASSQSITLEGSTDSLEIVTSSAASTDYTVVWSNVTATALTTPGTGAGNIASATTTAIIAAPSASNWRYVRTLTLRNASTTTSNTVTVQVDRSAANRTIYSATLAPGEELIYNGEWQRYAANGSQITNSADAGTNGTIYTYYKVGTAKDAAGYWILGNKDGGHPGAWVLGTPGVNGANFDCSTGAGATVAGAHVVAAPASGNLYLTSLTIQNSVTEQMQLVDLLWYNTGLVVTTTTAQAVVPAGFPARDRNGSTNGEGVKVGLYALTALGNAAAVSNSTISYTDESGNAGAVGTFQAAVGYQAPATPVIGTFMPFTLAAGDRGVRTLASVTLATTYTSGTMSLIAYRPLMTLGTSVVNVPATITFPAPGIRVYGGTCFAFLNVGSATLALANASFTVVERP